MAPVPVGISASVRAGDFPPGRPTFSRHPQRGTAVTRKIKVCSKCQQKKPADTEHFRRSKSARDGLDSYCRECGRAISLAHYYRNKNGQAQRMRNYAARKPTWAMLAAILDLPRQTVMADMQRGFCMLPGWRYCNRCSEIKEAVSFWRNSAECSNCFQKKQR